VSHCEDDRGAAGQGLTALQASEARFRAIAEDRIVGLVVDGMLVRRAGLESLIGDSAAPIHDCDGRVTGAVKVTFWVRSGEISGW
jgi:hypothetical protein